MMYTILQIDRSSGQVVENVVRSFELKAEADQFLDKLAKKQRWTLHKGHSIDRYVDNVLSREYYVTSRNIDESR